MMKITFDRKRKTVELGDAKGLYSGTLYGVFEVSTRITHKEGKRDVGTFLLHDKDGKVIGILDGWSG